MYSIRHDAESKRRVLNMLRRAHGQLAAVISAMERDAHCRDVVQQLAAGSKALDRAGFLVISGALKDCLSDPDGAADAEELEKLLLTLALAAGAPVRRWARAPTAGERGCVRAPLR